MRLPDDYVYLDWAATAPLCTEAARAMEPYFVPGPANLAANGNANSLHTVGRTAFAALEDARLQVSRAIWAARPGEVIFTSGATEADNLALVGITDALLRKQQRSGRSPHGTVITTAVEHDAVLSVVPELRDRGLNVKLLPVDRQGFVTADSLGAAITEDTLLVSVMMANNEMGAVQDIRNLATIAHRSGALFHTDATQAFGKVPVNVRELGVDAASFSAHKVCGPKGVGALYLKAHTPLTALVRGGGQEENRRSGTQNVAGAVGFAAAMRAAAELQDQEARRERVLRDRLYAALCAHPGVHPVVAVEPGSAAYLPNIVDVTVDGMESETLILQLDLAGFAVSGGSACSTGSLDPSHVLTALGIARDRALGALRVSFGRYTTETDIERFIDTFGKVVCR